MTVTRTLDEIIVGKDRQRQKFDSDSLTELADSIEGNGLLHAPVVRSESDPTLVSGERRTRAIRLLHGQNRPFKYNGTTVPHNHIPVNHLGDRTLEEYESAELTENLQREDLTWQERAHAIDRLHKLRLSQNPKHTAKQTNIEVNGEAAANRSSTETVRNSQIISKHLDDPDVQKASTEREAMKIIRKKATANVYNALAKNSDTSTQAKSRHTLQRGDARDLLGDLSSETFDCLITDPPYGIGADGFGSQGAASHDYKDDGDYFQELMECLCEEAYRVLKPNAHGYIFCDIRQFFYLEELFTKQGFSVWRKPIIWYKHNGMLPDAERGPRYTYECIMYFVKGDRKVRHVAFDCITSVPRIHDPIHAAQKPVGVYVNLLQRSCNPGDKVLDPFAGSGPVFPASNKLNLTATGFNLNEDDYGLAFSRLGETYDTDCTLHT